MKKYNIPSSHLELLQHILMELILARDPEATFVTVKVVPEPD
jgi:hypothetical protein